MSINLKHLPLAALLLAFGCQQKGTPTAAEKATSNETAFTVKGTIKGLDSGYVYFSRLDTPAMKGIDSAKVVNGEFEFKGDNPHPRPYYIGLRYQYKDGNKLKMGGIGFQKIFFVGPGVTTITGQRDTLRNAIIKGTPAQTELAAFEQLTASTSEKLNNTYGLRIGTKKSDKRRVDSLDKALEEYNNQTKKFVVDHIKQHPSSHVSGYLGYTYLAQADVSQLKPSYDVLSQDVKDSYFGKELLKLMNASERTAMGSVAPDFSVPDPQGKKFGLSSFRGKYLLVDFWASWCGPCRAENPNLLKAYARYSKSNFEILSVSMDSNREAWLGAVKEDKLPWTQVSDLLGSKSPLKELYGIQSIPTNFLLDKDGKVIARNLRGGDLEKKLVEVVK